MADVFLSYASEDRGRIAPLVHLLEAEGWSVWCDRQIEPGVAWDELIERELDQAGCVAVVWSNASTRSRWVKTEAQDGLRRGILVPVRIDAVTIPLEFRLIQAADLSAWTGDPHDPQYQHLRSAIGRLLRMAPDARLPAPRSTARRPVVARISSPRWRRTLLMVILLVVAVAAGLQAGRMRGVRALLEPRAGVVIGVMNIRPHGKVEQWLCDFTRDKMNATLNRFRQIDVVPKQMIDFLRQKQDLSDVEAAAELEIDQMISGTIVARGETLVLQVEVSDIGGQRLVATAEATGSESDLESMQNRVAFEIIKALDVDIASSELDQLLALRPTARPEQYRLLAESMGGFEGGEDATTPPTSRFWLPSWPATAHAADGAEQADIEALLEAYRVALEAEDLARLESIHVTVSDRMRAALEQYFANATELRIAFSDLAVIVDGEEALATFTRSDDFVDAASGEPVHIEVRVSTLLEKHPAGWRIRGLQKPS
jgi:ketosteroid isomerase-like protein/TolB-like protein